MFVDASTFGAAHAAIDGEAADEHGIRFARLPVTAAVGAIRFTVDQLHGPLAALQTRGGGDGDGTGRLMFSLSNRATFAASGAMDERETSTLGTGPHSFAVPASTASTNAD